ncbi:MAG: LysM domain-containing protein [Lactobacillales bacterium]|jgi:LysM repeat protein|nr:LysM domain-containing protein [Lactobacillales bacterium]
MTDKKNNDKVLEDYYAKIKGEVSAKATAEKDPWDATIYDAEPSVLAEEDDFGIGEGRAANTKKKIQGNQRFMVILVVLLVVLAAMPIGTWFYLQYVDTGSGTSVKTSSTSKASASKSTSKSSTSVSYHSSETSTSTETSSSSSAAADTSAADTSTSTSSGKTYTIKSGDSPSAVANSHGCTLAELEAANPGKDFTKTFMVGEVINLP